MSGAAFDTGAARELAARLIGRPRGHLQDAGYMLHDAADALDAARAEVADLCEEAEEMESVLGARAEAAEAEVARLRAAMPSPEWLDEIAEVRDADFLARVMSDAAARIRSALDATNKPANKERIDMHEWTKNQPTERGWQRRWVVIQRKGRAPHPRIATVKNEPPAPLRVSLQGYPTLFEDDILLYGPLAPVQSVPPGWEEALDAHPVVPGEPRS